MIGVEYDNLVFVTFWEYSLMWLWSFKCHMGMEEELEVGH